MGQQDDGLGLSLSLRCPESQNHDHPPPVVASLPVNLLRSPLRFVPQHKTSDLNSETTGSFYPGIDVNLPIVAAECDEDVMVSSPNSAVSSLSGKRNEREDNDGERASSSLEIDDDGGVAADGRKKLRLSKEQMAVLEDAFKEHNTLGPKHKMALANQLNLRPRQVEVWFQNRRARTKLKQTEVECEYLRRCCDNLREENRRLHKEVTELRALKLSPQRLSPPTTLTMCPQCERVAAAAGRNQLPPFGSWAAVIPPQALNTHPPKNVTFVSKSKMV